MHLHNNKNMFKEQSSALEIYELKVNSYLFLRYGFI
jgi:hypothetical protein